MSGTSKRRKTREVLMTLLYQSEFGSDHGMAIQAARNEHEQQMDAAYFDVVASPLMQSIDDIDKVYQRFLPQSLNVEDMTSIERAVIRLAVFEMCFQQNVPKPVVMNEAIELAKAFGTEKGYQFVNAILDSVKRQL